MNPVTKEQKQVSEDLLCLLFVERELQRLISVLQVPQLFLGFSGSCGLFHSSQQVRQADFVSSTYGTERLLLESET